MSVNLGQVNNVLTIGSSTNNTKIDGAVLTINRPITIGYALPAIPSPPTAPSTSLGVIGGTYLSVSDNAFRITSTRTAFAPINAIPVGRYFFTIYVFIPVQTIVTGLDCKLVRSTSTIANNQTTTLDDCPVCEYYDQTYITDYQSINVNFQYDSITGSPNVAIGIKSGVNLGGTNSFFRMYATRIC